MDQERFDHLARGLATGASRRAIVRNLSGAALGGILVAVEAGEAGARRKKRGKRGAARVRAGGKCPRAKRCGKGKHAQCCSSSQVCDNGACVSDGRTVTLTWEPWVNPSAPDDHGFCYPTITVSGFAPGTYAGFASAIQVTVVVGADGTGSGSANGELIPNDGGAYVATVDGVTSAEAITDCWAA